MVCAAELTESLSRPVSSTSRPGSVSKQVIWSRGDSPIVLSPSELGERVSERGLSRQSLAEVPPPDAEFSNSSYRLPPAEAGDRNELEGTAALLDDWLVVDDEPLPPLDEELWLHGGSYLYAAEGDRLNWPAEECSHYDLLRLPECWQEPRPLTGYREFLGADPILLNPTWRWFGREGYVWEPRLVAYGGYQFFAFARREGNRRQDICGHQLLVDLDLRLTGTERFHVEYRPIGRERTGGSYYQLNHPRTYVDNSTGEPDQYWFEGELHSLLGTDFDPFAALDYNLTAGRVPLQLHNQLLINDELVAVILSKNTLNFKQVSNLNIQAIYGFSDVSIIEPGGGFGSGELLAAHASLDRHRVFYEATYAYVAHRLGAARDSQYAAFSRTALYGPTTLALRALLKWGDRAGLGEGQLFAAEAQRVRVFDHKPCGFEHGVFYCNTFVATRGWSPIAGGTLNRLTLAFEVDPLVRISAAAADERVWGAAIGAQLFRHHEDESLIPEIAFSDRGGTAAVGIGLRWLRKMGPRCYLEATGIITESKDPDRDRDGVAIRHTTLF